MANALLNDADRQALLKCDDFYNLLDRALGQLEQDDHYDITTQLRDVHTVLFKLVTIARAEIYSDKLKAILEKHDGNA